MLKIAQHLGDRLGIAPIAMDPFRQRALIRFDDRLEIRRNFADRVHWN